VLEIHAIAASIVEGRGRFAITMAAAEKMRFLRGVQFSASSSANHSDFDLRLFDLEQSECSRASDRESIHEGVRSSVGFQHLNRFVHQTLQSFCKGILESSHLRST
jgi:hypothetical protein